MNIVHIVMDDYGPQQHVVLVTLTRLRIVCLRYLHHPGLSTRTLAQVYAVAGAKCICVDFADSMMKNELAYMASRLSEHTRNMEEAAIVNDWENTVRNLVARRVTSR